MVPVIVFAHPYAQSFNAVIKDEVIKVLAVQGHSAHLIDLYQNEFNPTLSSTDLKDYAKGVSTDEWVLRYQNELAHCNHLILIFPIWWYDAPAIFKGFIDKVLLPGFAFDENSEGLVGRLKHIQTTTVITTSEVETDFMIHELGNPIETKLLNTTLSICGIGGNKRWFNCDHIASGTLESRQEFLKMINFYFHTI